MSLVTPVVRRVALPLPGSSALAVLNRNITVFRRRGWIIVLSGLGEPLVYLLGVGYGVGTLVGGVQTDDGVVSYAAFVAPALMASAAMQGAVNETMFNAFWKLRHVRLYDSMMTTPVGPSDVAAGEVLWALTRSTIYAAGFVVALAVFGLAQSPLVVLALPAAMLIAFAFAAVGTAAMTWLRTWQDFGAVQLAVLPMFLLSATFYPLSTYAPWMRVVVQCTPLYHGVHLLRALSLGQLAWSCLADVGYLALLGVTGILLAGRRLRGILVQ